MADKQQILKGIEYAKQNPNSPFAIEMRRRIQSGMLDADLKAAGVNVGSNSGADASKPQWNYAPGTTPVAPVVPEKKGLWGKIKQVGKDVIGIGSNIKNDIGDRKKTLAEGFQRQSEGKQGFGDSVLQTTGAFFGSGLDILTDTGKGLVKGAFHTMPDFVQKDVKLNLEGARDQFFSSSVGQQGIKALASGENYYSKWKAKNPRGAANLESMVNIASFFPALKGAQATAEGAAGILKEAGTSFKNATEATINAVKEGWATKAEARALKDTLEVVEPAYNKSRSVAALRRAGLPGGATETSFGTPGIDANKRAIEIARDAQGFVKKGESAIQNNTRLNKEIARIAEEDVRPVLQKNPRIFNNKTLQSNLENIPKPLMIKTDPILEKTYDLVKQRLMQVIDEHPHNMEGLWDARIQFDKIIEREFGEAAFDPKRDTAVGKALLDMRTGVNDFISESMGDSAGKTFSDGLRKMSNLHRAVDNIADSNYGILNNKQEVLRWMKNNPKKAMVLKWGVGIGGAETARRLIF